VEKKDNQVKLDFFWIFFFRTKRFKWIWGWIFYLVQIATAIHHQLHLMS